MRGIPALSMPAAELFTASVVPLVVSEHVWFDAVYAVGDCQPAVGVVNSVGSTNPQMNLLVQMGRRASRSWLGVHVRRELNLDPDRLSHPCLLPDVVADAREAGLRVVVVPIPAAHPAWKDLDVAAALGCGTVDSPTWPD